MSGAKNPNGETERLGALLELDLLGGVAFPDLDRLTRLVADVTGASIAAFTVHDSTRAYQISTSYGLREISPPLTAFARRRSTGAPRLFSTTPARTRLRPLIATLRTTRS